MMYGDARIEDLLPVVRRDGAYVLRRANPRTPYYQLWLDYEGPDEDLNGTALLLRDDLPLSACEDFDTYVDEEREEARVLMAQAREEFGF